MEPDILESSIEEDPELGVSCALEKLTHRVKSFQLAMKDKESKAMNVPEEEIEEEMNEFMEMTSSVMPPPVPPTKVIEWDCQRHAYEFQAIKIQISTLLQRLQEGG